MSEYIVIGTIIAAFAVAAVLSYFFTPPVKNFAHKVGAIDVPKDNRRMHKKPVPRLGGLAIFLGFIGEHAAVRQGRPSVTGHFAGRVHHRRFGRGGRYVPAARVF